MDDPQARFREFLDAQPGNTITIEASQADERTSRIGATQPPIFGPVRIELRDDHIRVTFEEPEEARPPKSDDERDPYSF